MLTTRPLKRATDKFLSFDMRYEILDGEQAIGTLIFASKARQAEITLAGAVYQAARSSDKHDERLYQALIRVMTSNEKPPTNPWLLKDAGGHVLALAERVKQHYAVSYNGDSFTFRKPSFFTRPFHLYRAGSDQSLGSVGQAKLLNSSLHMDLPADFPPPVQVFLLMLLLDLTLQNLESSAN
jgi:hypothetical protein